MCGVKKEIGCPNKPHDAHNAGSWGAARAIKCSLKPTKCSKYALWAVFVAANTSVGSTCAA